MTARRLPPPWTIIENAESFWVQDAGGQTVGWFYTGCISDCSHVGVCWLACGPRGRWHGKDRYSDRRGSQLACTRFAMTARFFGW
jgi:hypothetical protein